MKLFASIFFGSVFCTLFVLDAFSQDQNGRMSAEEFSIFLDAADKRVTEYANIFKNLSAEETKVSEIFEKSGELEKRKVILSDLIIYENETGKKKGELREYHNVREVDGKPVRNRDKRAIGLFKRLAKAGSLENDLVKIQKESLRHDTEISVYGITLVQTIVLSQEVRKSFEFAVTGNEKIGEDLAVVVKFQQITPNPSIDLKITTPDFLEASNPLFRGVIWIDLKTKGIRRFRREVTIASPRFTEPFVLLRQEAEYHPSEFGIALPVKIVMESLRLKATKKDLLSMRKEKVKPESYIHKRLSMEYKNFRKFDITVEANR